MNSLEDLKKSATAAELCLIEKVESLVFKKASDEAMVQVVAFIRHNPPDHNPHEEFHGQSLRRWVDRLGEHLLRIDRGKG